MLRICVYVIIILYFTYQAFGDISTDNETKEDGISRLIHKERRSLIAFTTITATISAIAGSLSIANQVQKWSSFDIDDDGAYFKINNHFEAIELHWEGTEVVEGSTREPAASLIRPAKKDAAGGVFDDSGRGDSAGYIQYEITNPITTDHYCIGYLWSSEADSVHGRDTGSNWLVALIRKMECPSKSDGFNYAKGALLKGIEEFCKKEVQPLPIKPLWMHCGRDADDYYFETTDYTYYTDKASHRIMHVKQARGASAVDDQFRIPSIDLKIGMRLHVATPDNDEDHPQVTIDVGPYKEIFGRSKSTERDFFVVLPNTKGGCGDSEFLGIYSNIRDCHYECINKKSTDCKYFSYHLNVDSSEFGRCTWYEKGCLDHGDDVYSQLFNNVKGKEYGLVENNRHCDGKRTEIGSDCNDSDECWSACKDKDGCEYFTFSVNLKKCYMESECGTTSLDVEKYNLYGKYKQ